MFKTFYDILNEAASLFNEMAIYLLFGFFVAGIIHIFLNTQVISKHLGKANFMSVLKASLFGIPLPLCSCGVIPAALSLRKDGASRGAVMSFLVSTPTTGMDSILATYALLGGFFTVYRVLACFIAALFVGVLANIFIKERDDDRGIKENKTSCCCSHHDKENSSDKKNNMIERIKGVFSYGFGELLKETGPSLIIGILIAGVISYMIPDDFFSRYLSSTWKSMTVMFLVGIPMYVCATGSIPIVVALMLKGLNPSAAFVFLLTGPATNAMSLFVIGRQLGFKAIVLLLLSLIVSSFALGFLLDYLWNYFDIDLIQHLHHQGVFLPESLKIISGWILLILIGWNIFLRQKK